MRLYKPKYKDKNGERKITISHNGFHGWTQVSFYADPERSAPQQYLAAVSLRTAKRLNNAVCGAADCKCGEALATILDNRDGTGGGEIHYASDDKGKTGEVIGIYPQT